ncbi:metal-dependent hydrolase [Desulfovermiculus halophilus]|uniref:metal-dependent hydrolase n=1 Tax=Desulfovermiculus halophilus TaxID=339722 RepID=UPI000482D4B0|nr:metal-dependent hydrolase [Desulfovermiculus halophilus]
MSSNTLTWHGHSNFQITTPNCSILIDPWFEGNPSACVGSDACAQVDLVLVTHDHDDHMGQAVDICKATGAHVGAVVETAGKLVHSGVPEEQIVNGIGFNIGGTVEFKGIQVTMVQAFHSSATGCPVGYILTLEDGYCLYHAGDTGIFSSMELFGKMFSIDLAVLPIGGIFTMDPPQAAMACNLLQCKNVLPMHWGSFPVLEQNTDRFARELQQAGASARLVNLEPGQSMELSA